MCSIPSNRLKQSGVQEAVSVRCCLFTSGPVQAGTVTRPEQPFIYSFRPPLGSLCSSPCWDLQYTSSDIPPPPPHPPPPPLSSATVFIFNRVLFCFTSSLCFGLPSACHHTFLHVCRLITHMVSSFGNGKNEYSSRFRWVLLWISAPSDLKTKH